MPASRPFRIAAARFAPCFPDKVKTIGKASRIIREAEKDGCRLWIGLLHHRIVAAQRSFEVAGHTAGPNVLDLTLNRKANRNLKIR